MTDRREFLKRASAAIMAIGLLHRLPHEIAQATVIPTDGQWHQVAASFKNGRLVDWWLDGQRASGRLPASIPAVTESGPWHTATWVRA